MKYLLLLFAIFGTSPANAEGGKAGNGGDAIRCKGKLYSLDFIQTQSNESNLLSVAKSAKSAKEITSYITEQMTKKIPLMAETLTDFNQINKNQFDQTTKRLWLPGPSPIDIKDEAITADFPAECLKSDGSPNIVQVVIRASTAAGIVYYYSPSLLRELESTSPVQLSFILIHEWLRDFTEDPYVIQRVNRMIHTEGWQSISWENFRMAFLRNGLDIPSELQPGYREAMNEISRKAGERADALRRSADEALLNYKKQVYEEYYGPK